MSLVPIASLGERYGVSVRGIEAIVRLACIIHRTDYWRRGRTVDKLGIADLSVSELTRYVNEGLRDLTEKFAGGTPWISPQATCIPTSTCRC